MPKDIEQFQPKELPEVRREMVRWMRESAPRFFLNTHLRGSKYYLLPELRKLPVDQAIYRLAQNLADVLHDSRLYSVTPEMTFLAAKTVSPNFHLTMDMLPAPRGFLLWQTPIGSAEETQRMQLLLDEHGDILSASLYEWLSGMGTEAIPVLGCSWELREEDDEVMVIFYSSRNGMLHKMGGGSVEYETEARKLLSPVIFEREQLLPLNQDLGWFTAESGPRLELTAAANPDDVPPSMREDVILRNKNVLPMMDQMTKTLVATWMLMGMKFTKKEVQLPDRAARKRMRREGASEGQINAGVQVVKLGGPLRTQKPREGEPSYRWKKRRIVGPFVRNQWYPSEETHKPKLIEPYIAGPEGAPIGNAEKVYLLSE